MNGSFHSDTAYDMEKAAGVHKSADSLALERAPNRDLIHRNNFQLLSPRGSAHSLQLIVTIIKNRRRDNGSAVLYGS